MGAEESGALNKLGPAYSALDAGETDHARLLAQQSLTAALAASDRLLEAEALLCLSVCDRYASRFRRCFDASLRASQLFQALGLADREAAALTTLSYAAGTLGRHEEAVEASLLALRLIESTGKRPAQVAALNYLGVNYFFAQSFDDADAALRSAIDMAETCEPKFQSFQPALNLAFSQYFRASIGREHTGKLPDLVDLNSSVAGCFEASKQGHLGLSRGLERIGHVMWDSLNSIHHTWNGDMMAARDALSSSRKWIAACGSPAWLKTLAQLAETELLWANGQPGDPEESALATLRLAAQAGHEPLARMAHSLAGHIYQATGRQDLALEFARKLRRREQQIRSEALASRAKVVDWQLAIRSSERDVERLQTLSRHLERVSLEDPLTHLANRRKIEQRLVQLLEGPHVGRPGGPCVALIDVDAFKRINDTFSHQTGDRVLLALAQIFTRHAREGDLIGRLAGDEFVILFSPCGMDSAERACARIQEAVASHDWDEIATGLRVSISVGIAQGSWSESPESILHRSDLAMYKAKPSDSYPAAESTAQVKQRPA